MVSKADFEVIFNDTFNELFDEFVTPALLDAGHAIENVEKLNNWMPKVTANALSCSYCRESFLNVQQQREHYKLDWHRYNLKQSLQGKEPIAEEDFNLRTENDEVSSISGSDSEEDEQDSLENIATAQGKIFLENAKGQVFSMYRGVLMVDKKEDPSKVDFFKRFRQNCSDNKQWTILMLGGGHFAGAIFNYLTPIVHKTFHCYTVRAGQGGSQSGRDNKSGGSHPKSAGASLRRYNEQALIDHVRSILVSWTQEMKKSSLVFYRASGPYNKGVLFGGKEPVLDRADIRLRTIPFSTGRATYSEVKRVHLELCSAQVYGSLNAAVSRFSKHTLLEKDERKSKTKSCGINRAKSREVVDRPLPGLDSLEVEEDIANTDEEICFGNENLEISFKDLEEFGDSLSPDQRARGQMKKRQRKSKTQKLKEKEEARKKYVIDTITKGNSLILEDLLRERLNTFQSSTTISREEVSSDFFNEVLDERGNSYLHLAAMNEHEELLNYLLSNNADPCLKNKEQKTPYSCTTSKLSRDVLRKFAREHPEKYNYNKAQIPLNVLTEEQMAEKKRAQKKIKKEKEKEKKKENYLKLKEENEKERFINLSDREKRALAAERRILNTQGKVIARCFLCGSDMAGKVPFEYLENRFCSIDCLKSHRMKNIINI
ncbi:tRNA endonuclease ANKZF1-like [Euwallacea fornicatus]|uniref:tRNA endonuclease ANKZF1-like n=1 Tax=Euwallacea fornicatus TaxID=995702 RepID=UPI00338D65AE